MFVCQNTEVPLSNLRQWTSATLKNTDEFQKHMLIKEARYKKVNNMYYTISCIWNSKAGQSNPWWQKSKQCLLFEGWGLTKMGWRATFYSIEMFYILVGMKNSWFYSVFNTNESYAYIMCALQYKD